MPTASQCSHGSQCSSCHENQGSGQVLAAPGPYDEEKAPKEAMGQHPNHGVFNWNLGHLPPVEETSRNRPGPRLCTCCLCPGCQRPWPARSQFLNDQRKAREELLDSCHGGALGPLIQEAKLTTSDGAPVTIYFANFLVYLASLFQMGGSFHDLLQRKHQSNPSSVHRPWNLILYIPMRWCQETS